MSDLAATISAYFVVNTPSAEKEEKLPGTLMLTSIISLGLVYLPFPEKYPSRHILCSSILCELI